MHPHNGTEYVRTLDQEQRLQSAENYALQVAREKVKNVHADAEAIWTSRGWRVIAPSAESDFDCGLIGRTDSAHVPELEAWDDAAKNLAKR